MLVNKTALVVLNGEKRTLKCENLLKQGGKVREDIGRRVIQATRGCLLRKGTGVGRECKNVSQGNSLKREGKGF